MASLWQQAAEEMMNGWEGTYVKGPHPIEVELRASFLFGLSSQPKPLPREICKQLGQRMARLGKVETFQVHDKLIGDKRFRCVRRPSQRPSPWVGCVKQQRAMIEKWVVGSEATGIVMRLAESCEMKLPPVAKGQLRRFVAKEEKAAAAAAAAACQLERVKEVTSLTLPLLNLRVEASFVSTIRHGREESDFHIEHTWELEGEMIEPPSSAEELKAFLPPAIKMLCDLLIAA